MKAPNLKKWPLSPQIEGLLFFAQLVDELLFDYTIDTYKIPALNTRLLAHELYSSLIEHEDNTLRYGALEPIVKELKNRLKKDPAVKEILKDYNRILCITLSENSGFSAPGAGKYIFLTKKSIKSEIPKQYR